MIRVLIFFGPLMDELLKQMSLTFIRSSILWMFLLYCRDLGLPNRS